MFNDSYFLSKEQVELQKRILFKHIRENILKVNKLQLSRALNVGQMTISNIESGNKNVSNNMFLSLYALLKQCESDENLKETIDIKAIKNIIEVIESKYIMINHKELF